MWYVTAVCGFLSVCGLPQLELAAAQQATGDQGYFIDALVEGEIPQQFNCPDGAKWDSLMGNMPPFSQCGRRFKNLTSSLSKNHPHLHYSNLGEYPSVAFVIVELEVIDKAGKKTNIRQTCNGFLITNQHVMTAAHCLNESPVGRFYRSKRVVKVLLGDFNSEVTTRDCVTTDYNTTCAPTPLNILVEKIATYPQYDRFSLHHDIAVLQLETTVTFSDYIQPICLPHGCGFEEVGRSLNNRVMKHVGWKLFWPNKGNNFNPPKEVQKTKRIVVTPFRSPFSQYGCDKAYLWMDNYTQLCTHDYPLEPEEQVNCDAFAGGPLVVEYGDVQFAWAMASFGEACNIVRSVKNGDPLVMTWLLPYMRWVLKTVYFLKTGQQFPLDFTDIRVSTGEPDD